eukprot:GHVH01007607.1.p2 GENE.GHVH01007607.1~~GHVH01007607.1.p2  ORF type:complete len:137 (-),score=19.82 GHVH01007607.1:174-584(-)
MTGGTSRGSERTSFTSLVGGTGEDADGEGDGDGDGEGDGEGKDGNSAVGTTSLALEFHHSVNLDRYGSDGSEGCVQASFEFKEGRNFFMYSKTPLSGSMGITSSCFQLYGNKPSAIDTEEIHKTKGRKTEDMREQS